ncbi:MAG TPA: single-stranded DNA-binding protein [Nocardioides sp.]|uniref:single-stranded DNA-binding protein n=1 Tax=uncultured Nocardioides sp. TaxID=198441 RepID=UPI000EE1ABC9|nr:single-stranded DNA-binding protein [uncultured Nocardioides sp.]HCB02944.1 single-stranded DNA-binding protein [Nocardioides sp.]HRI94899.1 single-stranded DNA-binding protein [Nocardioides sp.]HRK47603.1 single-stranded DNA-binding protein [Nocardioides sp.]
MTAHDDQAPGVVEDHVESVNEVRLLGRLSTDPELRELPSGDTLWTLRVVVARPPGSRQHRARQRVDALECAVWSGRLKRQVAGWKSGDVVDVSGALRRRFYRAGATPVSRVEVELARGRIIRRAASG